MGGHALMGEVVKLSRVRRASGGLVVAAGVLAMGGGLALASGVSAQANDPIGHNGVVKVVGEGDVDDIPENNPHQGCRLGIEWYNYDQADIWSTITFEMWSPTDATLTVDGPSSVFVGEDHAGGTKNDLDAREWYTLNADGLAHPEQGFHVKVTVDTPGSRGTEKKSKVFWFQNCETPTESPSPTPTETITATPTETPTETPTDSTESPSPSPTESTDTESPSPTPTHPETADTTAPTVTVPTSVEAGSGTPGGSAQAMIARGMTLAGGLLVAGGVLISFGNRRRGAHLR